MIDDTAYSQRLDTLLALINRREARIAELEAANAGLRELNATLVGEVGLAEARLAAVIALCDASDQGYDWSCFVSDIRAAATGDTT